MSISSVSSVKITYPELLQLHNQKETLYNTTKQSIEASLGEYEQNCADIAGFTEKVREKGDQLQHRLTGVSVEQLKKDRTAILEQYEAFKASSAKLNLLADRLAGAVTSLTPVARTWTTEAQL